MSSSLIVEVCRIKEIKPHKGADRLDIAIVKAWETIVKKDEYRAGDVVVFIPPDAILPTEMVERLGVGNYLAGKNSDRVKCAKLRGEMSFGLVIPNEENWEVGTDVAGHYGITKYEPPVRAMAGDAAPEDPYFTRFTNIENIRNYPDIFTEGEMVVVTEKIDGSNQRLGFFRAEIDGDVTIEWKAGSHKVKRKMPEPDEIKSNIYWYPYSLPGAKDMLLSQTKKLSDDDVLPKAVTLFGEVYGRVRGGHKSLHYGKQNELAYVAFGLQVDGEYVDWEDFAAICRMYDIPMVPVIAITEFNMDKMKELSKGDSILAAQNGATHMREGIVICSMKERDDLKTGRAVLKLLNDDYLILKGKRESKGEIVDFTDV